MSSILLSSIVGDPLNNRVINLKGLVQVRDLAINNVTESTSLTSGGLVVSGGLGIAKNISIGGNVQLFGTPSTYTVIGGNDNTRGLLLAPHTNGATFALNGSGLSAGNARLNVPIGAIFDIAAGDNSVAQFMNDHVHFIAPATMDGAVHILNTTDAVSVADGGSLTVRGGLAVSKSMIVGAAISVAGPANLHSGLSVTSAMDATGDGLGSISTVGGAFVGRTLRVAGNTVMSGLVSASDEIHILSTADTSLSTTGGITVQRNLVVHGQFLGTNAAFGGTLRIDGTAESTSSITGAIVVSGGLGVGGSLYAGTRVNTPLVETSGLVIAGNTSTLTTGLGTGAVIFQSGLSVAQATFFGDTLNVSGSSQFADVTVARQLRVESTDESTGAGTGAIVCSGGMSVAGNVHVAGDRLTITSTQNTFSPTTGSMVLSGGVGIAKDLSMGGHALIMGAMNVNGAVTLGSTLSVSGATTFSNPVAFTHTTDSTDLATGSLVTSGGLAVAKRTTTNQLTVADATLMNGILAVNGVVGFRNVAEAVSLTQAAVALAGGLAVAKSVRVGGNAHVAGDVALDGTLTVSSTVDSINAHTGALRVAGGIGVAGSVHADGQLTVGGNTTITTLDVTETASFTASATFTSGLHSAGNINTISLTATDATLSGNASIAGALTISNTIDSTSATTGALVSSGGLGILKNAFFASNVSVGGALSVTQTIANGATDDSVSASTGSFKTAGGIGIAKSAWIGGGLNVAGSVTAGPLSSTQITLNSIALTDLGGRFTMTADTPGLRVAGTTAVKLAPYVNSIDLFSLGNTYTDPNHEVLQFTTTSIDRYTIMARSAGTGISRTLVLQSGGANTGQLALNPDGTASFASTSESAGIGSGAVTVAGGISVAKNISIGGSLALAAGSHVVQLAADPTTTGSYSLVLPAALPAASNYALVSDTTGNLKWSEMVTSNPTFANITVTSTENATEAGAGSIRTAGGMYATRNIVSSGSLINGGFDFILGSADQTSRGASNQSRALVKLANSILAINYGNDFSGGTQIDSVTRITNGTDSVSKTTGALQVAGGLGVEKSITCGLVETIATARSAPTLTTRSPGTRFLIASTVAENKVDCAIGIDATAVWYSATDASMEHRWYAGNTNVMTLSGTGTLTAKSLAVSAAGTGTVKFSASGSAYTLKLPDGLPAAPNQALVSDTQGNLTFSEMVTSDPSFTTIRTSTAIFNGSTSGTVSLRAPATSSGPVFTLPSAYPDTDTDQVLTSDASGNWTWTDQVSKQHFSVPSANSATGVAVTGLILTGLFSTNVLVRVVVGTDTLSAMFTLRGFPVAAGGYSLYQSYLGDDTGVTFAIGTEGQISYSSTTIAGWTSGTISWYGQNPYSKLARSPTQSSGQNNVTTPQNVSRLILQPPQFSIIIIVTVTNTDPARSIASQYKLDGVYQPNATWVLNQSFSGPDSGITFSILPSGQVQYTSPNIAGWLSTTFQFYDPARPLSLDASFSKIVVRDGGMDLSTDAASPPLSMTHKSAPTKRWFSGPDPNGTYQVQNDAGIGAFMPYGSGTWSSTSDARIKKNISTIDAETAADAVGRMNPVTFNYLEDPIEQPSRYGLIAQELEMVLPDLVTKCNGKLAVSYTELIPVLISAIKGMQQRIDALERSN